MVQTLGYLLTIRLWKSFPRKVDTGKADKGHFGQFCATMVDGSGIGRLPTNEGCLHHEEQNHFSLTLIFPPNTSYWAEAHFNCDGHIFYEKVFFRVSVFYWEFMHKCGELIYFHPPSKHCQSAKTSKLSCKETKTWIIPYCVLFRIVIREIIKYYDDS